MIKGLFETHSLVENLEKSIDFYANVLGLEVCYFEAQRPIPFFWIGKSKEAMLGLWEKRKVEIDKGHFAFRCDTDDVLNKSIDFLKERNLKPQLFERRNRKTNGFLLDAGNCNLF
jgi:lactoylglutathione lyase